MMKLIHMVCALTLLTPGLKSLSEISSTVPMQCAPTAVRGSDGTMKESQAYFGVLTTTLQVFKSAIQTFLGLVHACPFSN